MIRTLLQLSNDAARRMLRQLVALIVVTGVLQGVAFVLLVPLLQALFDVPGDPDASRRVLTAWLWLAGVGVLYVGATWWASILGQRSAVEVLASLEERIGDRLVELPLGWFASERSGQVSDLATRGVIFAASAPYAVLRPILHAFLVPGTVVVGTFFVDWRIALVLAASAPVMWFVYRWLSGALRRTDATYNVAAAHASSRIIEFATSQPAVRTAGDGSVAQQLVDAALVDQHRVKRRSHLVNVGGLSVFGVVVQLTLVAMTAVGTFLALGGTLDVAVLVALLVLGVRFIEPINNAASLSGGVGMASNTLESVQGLIDTPSLPDPATPGRPADSSVRLDDVTFGYDDGSPVLRGVSFEVPAGTTTAVVGPSGSGKTTITRLLARFYDPQEGQVLLGGVSLPDLGTDEVTRQVSPVFQDVYLFDDTILANVWVGRPDATREEALEAARLARVDDIADRLPGGWEARVGEGGANLSGGERQRVSIARALLKDAPVVLLDEATAALDARNEEAIQAAIAQVSKDRTVIAVAHRLQTILAADQIVMLAADGTVAERGTHAELLAAGGRYAAFWDERLSAQGWQIAHDTGSTDDNPTERCSVPVG